MINARLLHIVAALLACAALAPAPVRAQEPAWADALVAIVEGEPITLRELELACRLHPAYHDLPRGDSRERQEFRRAILHEGVEKGELGLIAQKVLLHKAKEAKVELTSNDEERLNQEIARMAERQPGGIDGLREALRRIEVPYEYFVERKRANLHITKLLLTSVSREIFITPTEIRHQYELRRAEFERPGELRLRQIVLYLDPLEDAMSLRHIPADLRKKIRDKDWDARAFATELRAKIDSGELAFEHAQRTYSMGLVVDREEVIATHRLHEASLFPPVPSRVAAMAVGELSEIVETSGSVRSGPVRALHLLLLVDRQDQGVLPLEEVQERLELELKEEVWEKRRDAFITKARADAHVLVFLPAPGN